MSMFTHLLTRAQEQIATIKNTLLAHAIVRDRLNQLSPEELQKDPTFSAIAALKVPSVDWRIFDHCAGFVRVYAVYERFVKDIVEEWLKEQPSLRVRYADLPEPTRKAYRVGVAEILQKFGGDRWSHLTELVVVDGFHAGLGGTPYTLLPDAFFTGDQNLRFGTLDEVLKKVGIDDLGSWVSTHSDLRRFLQETRGGGATCESELKELVGFRNSAAHEAQIEDIASPESFAVYSEFVSCLCAALHDLISHHILQLRIANGTAARIGIIVKRFKDNVVGAEVPNGSLRIGDSLFVFRPTACYTVTIESIQIDDQSHESVSDLGSTKVGLKLTRDAKEGSYFVRMTSPMPVALSAPSGPAATVTTNLVSTGSELPPTPVAQANADAASDGAVPQAIADDRAESRGGPLQ
jgi:hypothetical protein